MYIQEMLLVIASLFIIGISGIVLNKNNLLIVLMSIEIVLLSVNLNFIFFSVQFDDIVGFVFVLFVLAIAATESAIGLSFIYAYQQVQETNTY